MFKNLEAEMARYDISQKDIAECLGVKERTVRRYLAGTSRLPWLGALRIKHKFFPTLEVEYLFRPTNGLELEEVG